MANHVAVFLLTVALQASQTVGPRPPVDADLGKVFELQSGQLAKIRTAGLTIDFDRVAEDSRCPTGVQCVWEGDAQIELTVSSSSGRESLVLHTSRRFEREVVFDGWKIVLTDLKPRPREDVTLAAEAYRATLIVTPASDADVNPIR